MSKILRNDTASTVFVNDTGVSVPSGDSYTIPPQDYLLWAASSYVVTRIGDGDLIVNDGSFDLNISDGIDLIKGLYPRSVQVSQAGNAVNIFDTAGAVASGVETDVLTYTASDGDKLMLAEFGGTNIAKFELKINGVAQSQFLTHFCNLNGSSSFGGISLGVGDELKITVLHNRPTLGDFSAKIIILEDQL